MSNDARKREEKMLLQNQLKSGIPKCKDFIDSLFRF